LCMVRWWSRSQRMNWKGKKRPQHQTAATVSWARGNNHTHPTTAAAAMRRNSCCGEERRKVRKRLRLGEYSLRGSQRHPPHSRWPSAEIIISSSSSHGRNRLLQTGQRKGRLNRQQHWRKLCQSVQQVVTDLTGHYVPELQP
jgi:hypothetical protein